MNTTQSTVAAIQDEAVIHFEEGIIGVPGARNFVLLERPNSPFRVLKCADIEGFNLPVVDPRDVDPDYAPNLDGRVARTLQLQTDDPVLVLAVATLDTNRPMANLRAPVVINVRRRRAMQVILDDRTYPLRAAVST